MLKKLKIVIIVSIILVISSQATFLAFFIDYHPNIITKYAPESANGEEHEFRFGFTPSVHHTSLDPTTSFYNEIFLQCLETLFAYNLSNPGAPLIARLAKGYKWHNETSLEIELRENVKFHDDTAFNATAVIWNIERIYNMVKFHDPNHMAEFLYRVDPEPFRDLVDLSWVPEGTHLVDIVNKCVSVDNYRVRFDLNVPYSPFIYILAASQSSMISPMSHAEDKSRIIDFYTDKLVGTGPFEFISYDFVEHPPYPPIQAEVKFRRNDNYWREPKAYISNLTFYCYTTDINDALLNGEVDYIEVPSVNRYDDLSESPTVDLIKGELSVTNYFLGLNCLNVELPVRTAIARAFNYTIFNETIINGLLQGYAKRSRGPIPKGIKYYNGSIPTPGDDPDEDLKIAKNALINAGYDMKGLNLESDPQDWIDVAESDAPIAIVNYSYYTHSTYGQALYTNLSESCKYIGIKVEDCGLEWHEYWPKIAIAENHHELELFSSGWIPDYPDPSNYIISLFSHRSPNNIVKYDDDDTEKWMYKAITEIDEQIIQECYNNISRRLQNETYPMIFLFQAYNFNAINNSWTGIEAGVFNRFFPYFYPAHEKTSGWIPEKDKYAYILLDVDEGNPSVFDPISDISLDFANINNGGTVIVQISDETPEPIAGFDVMGTYYDISTTVDFNGIVIVGMPYDDTIFGGDEQQEFDKVFVMHYDKKSQRWKMATRDSIDTVRNIVYVRTTSFSIFAVMRLNYISYIVATIDIDPDVYNLKNPKNFITAYIEFPEELQFDISQINIDTIFLGELLPVIPFPYEIGDYDYDGIPDLMVKFDITLAKHLLVPTENLILEITGQLYDRTEFKGYDTVRII